MSNTLSVTVGLALTTVETVAGTDLNPRQSALRHDQFNVSQSLGPNTSPTGLACAYFTVPLVAGAANIDLTNLTSTNGAIVNGTGLKVRAVLLKCPPGNAGPITVAAAVANGYALLGSGGTVPIGPGEAEERYRAGNAPTIGSGAKNIALSGTGTDSISVALILG